MSVVGKLACLWETAGLFFTEALEEEISWECQPAENIQPLDC